MDDNKILEVLAEILHGQTEMKKELRQSIQDMRKDIQQLTAQVEVEVMDKIHGLYEAREVQATVLARILNTLEGVEAKLHSVQVDTYRALYKSIKLYPSETK